MVTCISHSKRRSSLCKLLKHFSHFVLMDDERVWEDTSLHREQCMRLLNGGLRVVQKGIIRIVVRHGFMRELVQMPAFHITNVDLLARELCCFHFVLVNQTSWTNRHNVSCIAGWSLHFRSASCAPTFLEVTPTIASICLLRSGFTAKMHNYCLNESC